MNIIETARLGRRYRNTWALRDCNLAMPEGRVAALVGPAIAGCGIRYTPYSDHEVPRFVILTRSHARHPYSRRLMGVGREQIINSSSS